MTLVVASCVLFYFCFHVRCYLLCIYGFCVLSVLCRVVPFPACLPRTFVDSSVFALWIHFSLSCGCYIWSLLILNSGAGVQKAHFYVYLTDLKLKMRKIFLTYNILFKFLRACAIKGAGEKNSLLIFLEQIKRLY